MWEFGDHVKTALDLVGISQDRVSRWLGQHCRNCEERRRRLNRLGWMCHEIVKGNVPQAKEILEDLLQG